MLAMYLNSFSVKRPNSQLYVPVFSYRFPSDDGYNLGEWSEGGVWGGGLSVPVLQLITRCLEVAPVYTCAKHPHNVAQQRKQCTGIKIHVWTLIFVLTAPRWQHHQWTFDRNEMSNMQMKVEKNTADNFLQSCPNKTIHFGVKIKHDLNYVFLDCAAHSNE